VQDPPFKDAVSQINSSAKGSESVRRPARVDQRRTERSQHIRFTILRATPAGQPKRGAELTDPRAHVTDIAKDDPCSLARYRRRIGIGPGR